MYCTLFTVMYFTLPFTELNKNECTVADITRNWVRKRQTGVGKVFPLWDPTSAIAITGFKGIQLARWQWSPAVIPTSPSVQICPLVSSGRSRFPGSGGKQYPLQSQQRSAGCAPAIPPRLRGSLFH